MIRLWLDDLRTPNHESYTWVKTVADAIYWLSTFEVIELSADHDLGIDQRDGYEVLLWIEQEINKDPRFIPPLTYVHSANSGARTRMDQCAIKINEAREARLTQETFDPPLDAGIESSVRYLRKYGVETYESCEGGPNHAYPYPSVRFHGDAAEGLRVAALCLVSSPRIPAQLARVYDIRGGELHGPYWEIQFGKER